MLTYVPSYPLHQFAAMDIKGARPPPPNPVVPHREDCWSESATAALIDAWGELFVQLDRGHLRRENWHEVAEAVNSIRTAERRAPRTDIQCKNRVDTIKRKYKSERARIAEGRGPSTWPFYDRIHSLIGDQAAPSKKGSRNPRSRGKPLPPPAVMASRPPETPSLLQEGIHARAAAAAAAARMEDEDEVESESSLSEGYGVKRKWREEEGGRGMRELARAIATFGKVYEKVEAAKQKRMVELEDQKMEFLKWLEVERMEFAQLLLERIKRARLNSDSSAPAGQ